MIVTDNGGVANGGVTTFIRTFTVTVTPINQAPTLNAINNPAAINENVTGAPTFNISLTGIGPGPGDAGQFLTVVATSSNPALIPNPTITYSNPATTGTLTYAPASFSSGTAVITVTVTDNGGTSNGGINTFSQMFTVTVNPINQAPTIDNIPDPDPITENNLLVAPITLTGITAGNGDTGQVLNVFATSSNPALIFNPAITYTSPNTTGNLIYSLVPNASGTAVISVTVQDNGGVTNGGVNKTTVTFNVVVLAVDQPPTLDFIPNPASLKVNAGRQTVGLTGIGQGVGDKGQALTITATSSNPALIPDPTVTYTSPSATGSLSFTPVNNSTGTAIITVTVTDDGDLTNGGFNSVTQTFTVAVAPSHIAPVIATTPGSLAYIQGQLPQPIDPGVMITDVDSPTIAQVTVAFTGNFVPSEDELDFVDPTGGLVTTNGFQIDPLTGIGSLTLVPTGVARSIRPPSRWRWRR